MCYWIVSLWKYWHKCHSLQGVMTVQLYPGVCFKWTGKQWNCHSPVDTNTKKIRSFKIETTIEILTKLRSSCRTVLQAYVLCNRYLLHFFVLWYVNKGMVRKCSYLRHMYLLNDFRRGRILAKNSCYVRHARLSVHIYLILGNLMRICWGRSKLVKIEHFIRRRKYVLLLPTN